jgi:hypothetical protein
MRTETINGLTLLYEPQEAEAAAIVREACRASIDLLHGTWGLPIPRDCRVIIMTSWQQFMTLGPPLVARLPLAITRPLWQGRYARVWPLAGGWAQTFGWRRAVGVKPPRLIESADQTVGAQIFIRDTDLTARVQNITCHELTHAFTVHLLLPMWLHEGLAMIAAERYLQRQTIQPETVAVLTEQPWPGRPLGYRGLQRRRDWTLMAQHYQRGYWLTRFLLEAHPNLLRELLAKRRFGRGLDAHLAATLGIARADLWDQIDTLAAAHFASNPV